MKITVNKAMVDYITCTTRDPKIADKWWQKLTQDTVIQEDKIKRYEGYRGVGDYAGAFIGKSVGRAKAHYIMQVSGAIADKCTEYVTHDEIKDGSVKCTRIDVQVTIGEPRGWSQIGYNESCERAQLKPEVKRSRNPVDRKEELITVYTGTRTSGRYNRLYQKVMESRERLLRYETEFSRGYAKAIAYGLLSGDVTREMVIRGEIKRRKVDGLKVFDLWQCGLFEPKQEERQISDNRAEWLIGDILPVFFAYINSHDADERVIVSFENAINIYRRYESG